MALLKRCSRFDLDFTSHKNSDNVPKKCDVIVEERTKQLRECKEESHVILQEAHLLDNRTARGWGTRIIIYERWLRVTNTTGVGDADPIQQIRALIEVSAKVKSQPVKLEKPKVGRMKMVGEDEDGDNESDPDRSKTNAVFVWDLREMYCLRHLEKEPVGRIRSLRYFEVVRDSKS